MNEQSLKFDWKKVKNTIKTKEEEQKNKGKDKFKDDRFYYPKLDPTKKTGSAIIRFLPMKVKDGVPMYELPYITTFKHNFKGIGGYYIEDCISTIGEPCYACEVSRDEYAKIKELGLSGPEHKDHPMRKEASQKYKKKEIIVNIQVVKDPQSPELNGKVFLFRVGSDTFNKIMDKWEPQQQLDENGNPDPNAINEDPINIWDYTEGLDFHLKITRKDGNANYSTSEWKAPRAISYKEQIKINEEMYDLNEFTKPERFKDYEVLKQKYLKVTGVGTTTATPAPAPVQTNEAKESIGSIKNAPIVTEDDSIIINEDEVKDDDDFFSQFDDASK